MAYQSFYLPIFFTGIFIKEYYDFFKKYVTVILIGSAVIFGLCLPFWRGEYYGVFLKLFSFQTLEFNFSDVFKGLYRIVAGVAGSVFFLTLFSKIYKENIIFKHLGSYGQYTMEIYILQVIIIETILTRVIDFPDIDIWLYSLIITPVIAVVVFLFCVAVIKIIQKNKYVNLLLFGRRI
jgi:hypothetical protein